MKSSSMLMVCTLYNTRYQWDGIKKKAANGDEYHKFTTIIASNTTHL